jgi:hypothetical protein
MEWRLQDMTGLIGSVGGQTGSDSCFYHESQSQYKKLNCALTHTRIEVRPGSGVTL